MIDKVLIFVSSEKLEIIFQEENCYEDLKTAIMNEFPEMKSVYLAIPISCFRDISKMLPCSMEDLMQIDQVTSNLFLSTNSVLYVVGQVA